MIFVNKLCFHDRKTVQGVGRVSIFVISSCRYTDIASGGIFEPNDSCARRRIWILWYQTPVERLLRMLP